MSKKKEYKENPPELQGCPDMSSLIYLEEENVMHNLKIRFSKQTVYTRVAKILISINPYEWLPFYTDELIKRYELNSMQEVVDTSIDPHCYNISSTAFNDMNNESKSQSLVVCGESGSGKTESAKALMSFLAKTKTTENSDKNLSEAVLAVNPILEAFGNAKTIMNNNSSRFGKFTKMIFTDYDKENKETTSRLVGTVIKSYLLEKSRVIMQNQGERNFHIFFLLLAGAIDPKKLAVDDPGDFYYLAQTEKHKEYHTVKGQNDSEEFKLMSDALTKININDETIDDLFSIVISVLHLGNINFEGETDVTIDSSSTLHFDKVAELLKVDQDFLLAKLTKKKFKIMDEVVISPFSREEAIDNRNSIAKSLYGEIFKWIIDKCNKELLLVKNYKKLRFIGILDVFGFECFERNSFEQFCINFANERLQQLFSESLMLSEQKEYIKEGIAWTPLKIPDNRAIMRLINKNPTGVFPQLEAACNMPKGKPEIFVSNVFRNNASSKRLSKVKPTKSLLATLKKDEKFNGFKIRHYADSVVYNCNEFLSKNTDRVSEETFELFTASKSTVLGELFPSEGGGEKKKKKRGSSMSNIGSIFTKELDGLISTLKKTSNFFVRCVNPNKIKSSTEFDYEHVKKQLRSGGLVQVLKVIKLGYPTRADYNSLNNYKKKIATHPILEGLKEKDYWSAILAAFNIQAENYQFGLTKLFFKSNINFIAKIKQFDGNLTEEMISKIRRLFVERRLRVIKGIVFAFLRINSQVTSKRLLDLFSKTLILETAFKNSLDAVREKIRAEKAEAEKERLRLEEERKQQEELERRKEEEKQRANDEARLQAELLEEKQQRILREQRRAQEEQQQKIGEIREKERLVQQREKEELERIEAKQREKMEEMQRKMQAQREEEGARRERQKREYEQTFEQSKKIKAGEAEKLEARIAELREEAQEIFEQNAREKEKFLLREREYEQKVRDKLEREREEALKKIMEDSKVKSVEMNEKLDEFETTRRAEIQALHQASETRLEEKKTEIDDYEAESKERIKNFNVESLKQLEEMKMMTADSQNKMKEMIDQKLAHTEEMVRQFEESKENNQREMSEKLDQIEFEKEKSLNDVKHLREMTENELNQKRLDVEIQAENVQNLEQMYKTQLEQLQKKRKSLNSREAQLQKKSSKLKRKSSAVTDRQNFSSALSEQLSQTTKTVQMLEDFSAESNALSELKISTRKDFFANRQAAAAAALAEKSALLLAKAKSLHAAAELPALEKACAELQRFLRGGFETSAFAAIEAVLAKARTAVVGSER